MAPTAALPTLTAEPGFPHYLDELATVSRTRPAPAAAS